MHFNVRKAIKRLRPGKLVAFILLLLMFGSTVAGFALQALNWSRRNVETSVELPKSNIIDYKLTAEQKNYLVRHGKTIMEYRYQLACDNCATQRAYLEAAANEFSDQIFLEEIVDNNATQPVLEMSSSYGHRSIADPSTDEILDGLCEIMVEPPARCITRNI